MARFRKNQIIQSTGRVTADLACNSNERATRVPLSSRTNAHLSMKLVAKRDSGGEKSFMSSRRRRSGCHSTISSTPENHRADEPPG